MKIIAIFLVTFALSIGPLAYASPARLSGLETVPQQPPVAAEESKLDDKSDSRSDSDSDSVETEPVKTSCCPSGFKKFGSNCYIGVERPTLAFNDVEAACVKLGAQFASIHSAAEYAWVKRNYDLDKFWIGVVTYEDGHHENEDGTDNDFQAFDDPVWDEAEKHPYICKKAAHC